VDGERIREIDVGDGIERIQARLLDTLGMLPECSVTSS
jgi:hypothetical protein